MPHHVVRRLVLIGLMVVVAALITVINPRRRESSLSASRL